MSKIKTRFAPSPTGMLHIGGVRTAFFCYLFAKKHQGEFIVRIEDTDTQRNVNQASQLIIDALNWLGLTPSIQPIFQTQRLEIYNTYLDKLISENKAYVCTCSKERLDTIRAQALKEKKQPKYDGFCADKNHPVEKNSVIRLKVNQQGMSEFMDVTHGKLKIENSQLDDLIIYRKGMPTYNFAVVIDDALMKISHVIRGDDHINNTFKQICIFNSLKFDIPLFSHLPMILDTDGSRLSKRNQASNVLLYQKQGYLPEAILNYLFRLGFAYGDQEIFSLNEMIKVFDLKKINTSAASINHEKLVWLNQHYIQKSSDERLYQILKRDYFLDLEESLLDETRIENHLACINLQKSRAKTISELPNLVNIFYQNEVLNYDAAEKEKIQNQISKEQLIQVRDSFIVLEHFSQENIHHTLSKLVQQLFNGQFGKLARGLRFILTSATPSGELSLGMSLMGKKQVVTRLDNFLKSF